MPFFWPFLYKYEHKLIFFKNLSSSCKLSNSCIFVTYVAFCQFFTFIKGLERFSIIGWVVGEKLVREYLDERTSQLHT